MSPSISVIGATQFQIFFFVIQLKGDVLFQRNSGAGGFIFTLRNLMTCCSSEFSSALDAFSPSPSSSPAALSCLVSRYHRIFRSCILFQISHCSFPALQSSYLFLWWVSSALFNSMCVGRAGGDWCIYPPRHTQEAKRQRAYPDLNTWGSFSCVKLVTLLSSDIKTG